jgi:putative FmdB family regulatory protein
MPTYEYYCKNGHEHVEIRSIFSEQQTTECPECALQLIQRIGSLGITFKGSGFYATDKKDSNGKAAD